MFELGMRLGREVRTRLGLQKQVNCYLAALNCLRLIRPEYAWIVQPASGAVVRNHTRVQDDTLVHSDMCTQRHAAGPASGLCFVISLVDVSKCVCVYCSTSVQERLQRETLMESFLLNQVRPTVFK